jgi:hypothetical protein
MQGEVVEGEIGGLMIRMVSAEFIRLGLENGIRAAAVYSLVTADGVVYTGRFFANVCACVCSAQCIHLLIFWFMVVITIERRGHAAKVPSK